MSFTIEFRPWQKKHHIKLRQEFDKHDAPETKYVVIFDNDFPIATARMYQLDSESIMFGKVVVLPKYRHRGIGTKVTQECEQWVLELGYQRAILESRDNKIPLYRQIGYI